MKNTPKKIKANQDPWESGQLGASEKFVRKVSSQREKTIDDNLDLQMISLRLQKTLINQLKKLASEDGMGYQPYMRQILTRHVRDTLKARRMETRDK